MEERTLKKTRIFPIWNMEKENAWLSDMAKAGWMLVRVAGVNYTFESKEPADLVFFHELRGIYGKTSKQLADDFEEMGWQHVVSSGAFDYFCSLATNKHLEIDRDTSGVKKRISMFLFLNIVAISNLTLILMMGAKGVFSGFAPFETGFLVIVLFLLPFLIYSTIRLVGLYQKIRRGIKQ